jgi:hypothetical protein
MGGLLKHTMAFVLVLSDGVEAVDISKRSRLGQFVYAAWLG